MKQTDLEKLEKRLEKMREKHYQNTKKQGYCQADDRRDWREREPLLNEINALKKELGL